MSFIPRLHLFRAGFILLQDLRSAYSCQVWAVKLLDNPFVSYLIRLPTSIAFKLFFVHFTEDRQVTVSYQGFKILADVLIIRYITSVYLWWTLIFLWNYLEEFYPQMLIVKYYMIKWLQFARKNGWFDNWSAGKKFYGLIKFELSDWSIGL